MTVKEAKFQVKAFSDQIAHDHMKLLKFCGHFVTEKLHFVTEKLHFVREKLHFVREKLHFVTEKLHFVFLRADPKLDAEKK
jgi:hypothetical protein